MQSQPLPSINDLTSRHARVSDPSLRWMAALYDPRTCAEEPSVPNDTQLSMKVKTFGRGSFSTGTTGYGGIIVSPQAMIANNTAFATTSAANTVAGASTVVSAWTNTVALGAVNSPFANNAYGSGIGLLQWKLVGVALYVKYAGTELNRGGDMILIEEPSHTSLSAYSYNNVLGLDFAKRVSVTNEWQHVCFTPASDAEAAYAVSSPSTTANYLGCFIASAAVSQPFDYEVFAWFEVVGSIARGASISYNDPIGYGAISGAMNQFQQLDSVVGSRGFVSAVELQLDNMSGVSREATHQKNWAGLAAFLPELASIAKQTLGGAASGLSAALNSGAVTPRVTVSRALAPPKPKPKQPKPAAKGAK